MEGDESNRYVIDVEPGVYEFTLHTGRVDFAARRHDRTTALIYGEFQKVTEIKEA